MASAEQTADLPRARLVGLVGFVSLGILAFEIALLRILWIASYHHMAFLVISVALLGFGASGTLLCFARSWLAARRRGALPGLALLAAVSMPLCVSLVQRVPLDSAFLPALLWRQIGGWILAWALLAVPFLCGATVLGLALAVSGQNVGAVYAANLFGSALGALAATAAMSRVDAAWLAPACAVPVLLGAAILWRPTVRGAAAPAAILACTVAWLWLVPPRIRLDPFKYGAHVQRLVDQGAARRVGVAHSARGLVERFRSDLFHDIPFLDPAAAAPPPMDALLVDGNAAGSILRIDRADEADFLRRTLPAFAYALAPPAPRVLLLGANGDSDVWLADRHAAARIDVAQADRRRFDLVRGGRSPQAAGVLDRPHVRCLVADPRHLVEHTPDRYDLIQLASLQSLAAGSAGMAGLAEDSLLTVEGLGACLERLEPQGVLVACRGMQSPPRDNLKLLATIGAALRRRHVHDPARHVVVVRDYLAVCTVVRLAPWTPAEVRQIRRHCVQRQLTPVWFPGVRAGELNAPDALDAPPDGVGDWYHHGARQLLGPAPQRFVAEWPFDIRPAVDDRPFFHDYFRFRSIGALRAAWGDLWLTRVELAFLFVLGAIALVGIASACLTLLPLLLARPLRGGPGRAATVAYFGALGLGYLTIEMVALAHATRLLGDPVVAASVTIAGFLALSGLGSVMMQRGGAAVRRRLPLLLLVLVGAWVIELACLGRLTAWAGTLALPWRGAVLLGAIGPLAVLLGTPMPAGLAGLASARPALLCWAWAVNGFASVLAAPLTTAIAMSRGYRVAGLVAALAYVVAAVCFRRLPCGPEDQPGAGAAGAPGAGVSGGA